jgi:hypothetical protein
VSAIATAALSQSALVIDALLRQRQRQALSNRRCDLCVATLSNDAE